MCEQENKEPHLFCVVFYPPIKSFLKSLYFNSECAPLFVLNYVLNYFLSFVVPSCPH